MSNCASDFEFEKCDLLALDRYITINAWNEWGEGPVLEPSNLYGREFLQAIREALIQES